MFWDGARSQRPTKIDLVLPHGAHDLGVVHGDEERDVLRHCLVSCSILDLCGNVVKAEG